MVLRALAALLLCAGCAESLFDAHGGTDGGPGGGGDGGAASADAVPVPETCPAGCLGDLAGDFDGSAGGDNGRWRYLEDARDRSWTAMAPDGDGLVGVDPGNRAEPCAPAAACAELPGALLLSSAGSDAATDPAVEFTSPTEAVLQVSLRILVPSDQPSQRVRLYRGSREDVLYRATALPGEVLTHAMTLDALEGERLLLDLAPTAEGASAVAVHLFINETSTTFPSACLVAVGFGAAIGNTVEDRCGAPFTHDDYEGAEEPPILGAGPYAESGQAADVSPQNYYKTTGALSLSGDFTMQFWLRVDALVDGYAAVPVSNEDLDQGGGIGFYLYPDGADNLTLEFGTTFTADPLMFEGTTLPFPEDGGWHFVRVVHLGDDIEICLDGEKAGGLTLPGFDYTSTFPLYLGKNVVWTPAGAFFDGGLDDVRVLSTALPCD